MKTLCSILYLLASILFGTAAEARVITETGATGSTNVLAIGIDARDFEVIRFYLKGTNTLELRADQLLAKDRLVLPPPPPPALLAERDSLLTILRSQTNALDITSVNAHLAISNLVHLRRLEDRIATGAGSAR